MNDTLTNGVPVQVVFIDHLCASTHTSASLGEEVHSDAPCGEQAVKGAADLVEAR